MEDDGVHASGQTFVMPETGGADSPLPAGGAQRSPAEAPARPLTSGDRLDVGGRGTQLIAHARFLGRYYEARYGNCAQSTIAALEDTFDFISKDERLFLAGSCLHGGATAAGNANCGAFTGAGIVFGCLCGRTRERFGDREALRLSNAMIRELAGRFEQAYGSVICKDVKERASKDCTEVVARAAGWAAEILAKQFGA